MGYRSRARPDISAHVGLGQRLLGVGSKCGARRTRYIRASLLIRIGRPASLVAARLRLRVWCVGYRSRVRKDIFAHVGLGEKLMGVGIKCVARRTRYTRASLLIRIGRPASLVAARLRLRVWVRGLQVTRTT